MLLLIYKSNKNKQKYRFFRVFKNRYMHLGEIENKDRAACVRTKSNEIYIFKIRSNMMSCIVVQDSHLIASIQNECIEINRY